ncbi:sodium:proton antiporter [Salinicola acroporae]|uniref:Nickel/cobalt efflux system n=2 Tax=Salinicola acroporae TaxID=1541440 RepID=A0ABT6I9X2_9GAMM|nr:sodium:proton antiporter [Salinicola acroporae]
MTLRFLVPLALLIGVGGVGYALGWWQQVAVQIVFWQGEFYHALVEAVSALKRAPDATTWAVLLGVSFGYGVFHAAGPGHGKVVLSTYLASQGGAWRRALSLSALAALLQGVMAIAIIGILVFGLGWLTREAMGSIDQAELASFAIVTLVGLWLCIRSLRRLWRTRHSAGTAATTAFTSTFTAVATTAPASRHSAKGLVTPAQRHAHDAHCGCGHEHHIDPRQAGDWRVALLTVLSIGIRPCSGAVLLLGAASLLDQFGKGVVAVMAMSLGTALTVSSLALLSVLARDWVKRHLKPARGGGQWQSWVGLAGGALILVLGLSLTLAQWQRGPAAGPPCLARLPRSNPPPRRVRSAPGEADPHGGEVNASRRRHSDDVAALASRAISARRCSSASAE